MGFFRIATSTALLCALAACGGSGGGSSSTPAASNTAPTFSVGGSISGLNSSGLQLASGDSMANIVANASQFALSPGFTSGTNYSVYIKTQPTAQQCEVVSNGDGVMGSAAITNVVVTCRDALHNSWVLVNGEDSGLAYVNPVLGVPTPGAGPFLRTSPATWTDLQGQLWLFGGASPDGSEQLNDFWRFDGTNWTLVADNAGDPTAPNARRAAATWVDAQGNLWLFGGRYYNSSEFFSSTYNDLWVFDGTRWKQVMSGDPSPSTPASYGSLDVAASTNTPPSRGSAQIWKDKTDTIWMYGGEPRSGLLADLWKFNGTNWVWEGGAQYTPLTNNQAPIAPVYGQQGVPALSNTPGGRSRAVTWVDHQGKLWLYGGEGYDTNGTSGTKADLWRLDGTIWTWMGGSTTNDTKASYGMQGLAIAGNSPGARAGSAFWLDKSGALWLYGGYNNQEIAGFADIWRFDGTNWAWMGGSTAIYTPRVVGIPGKAAISNTPGSLFYAAHWLDKDGRFWLFAGGTILPGTDSGTYNSDFWAYQP